MIPPFCSSIGSVQWTLNISGIPISFMRAEGKFKNMADEIALSFHDSLLRKSDLSLLEEGCWLNDRLIGFMFE